MDIVSAEFIKSSAFVKDCPPGNKPEYAFLGRSNVGKSSLINMLTGFGKLAKTSSTPGKTQLINHFLINNTWFIADLPGFGFAKVSKKLRGSWEKMIQNYLLQRENLVCTFLLIDSRHEPLKNDLENMEWFASKGLPFVLVFTKADKMGSTTLQTNIARYNKELRKQWDPLPMQFITSSEKREGRDAILDFIESCNQDFTIGPQG
ncbi:MAG: ribosome biogenesis GTP-binding protein YihA/YsxC [Bacteroidales bacterium]